eukprot:1066790-Pelagomonas_calceolata.AAC.1
MGMGFRARLVDLCESVLSFLDCSRVWAEEVVPPTPSRTPPSNCEKGDVGTLELLAQTTVLLL